MADATGVGSTGEIMMENLNQKEMLSALADGQLSGNALTQALEFLAAVSTGGRCAAFA